MSAIRALFRPSARVTFSVGTGGGGETFSTAGAAAELFQRAAALSFYGGRGECHSKP